MTRRLVIPSDRDNVRVEADGAEVVLTNVRKVFWRDLGITKGDLLQYYADVSTVLLPHIRNRAMVMKRYPHGAAGEFFFMKRAPSPRPSAPPSTTARGACRSSKVKTADSTPR